MCILALDVGDRRIGLALSDPTGMVARPLAVYERSNQLRDIAAILETAAKHEADALLVGMPLSLNGTEGPQALRVRRFLGALRQATPLPVLTADERYTTVEADRQMWESGLSVQRRKQIRDAVAAAVLLQSYLDTKHLEGKGL